MIPETPKHIEVVRVNAFERDILHDLTDHAPVLADLQAEADLTVMHSAELVQDINALFWMDSPEIRREEELEISAALNRVVVNAIMDHPDTADLRSHTIYDRYATALATASLSEEVITVLERYKEQHEELMQQMEEDKQEQERQRQEQQNGQPDPDGDGEQEGGDTPGGQGDEPGGYVPSPEMQQAYDDFLNEVGAHVTGAVSGAVTAELNERSEEEALFRAWGVDPGELQRMSFEERRDLAKRLRNLRTHQFIDMFGAMRISAKAEQKRKMEFGRDEMYGVQLGRDLAEVLPSEFVGLAHPSLRSQFMRRFAEGQLVSRKWRGVQKADKGPIVVTLDCSGSMAGAREAWAKAVCIALMDVARKDKRAFTCILFASAQQPYNQMVRVDGTDLESMIKVAETFWEMGGTNFDVPVSEALRIIAHEKEHQRSDLVMITDGECDMSTPVWAELGQAREKGLRVFGIDVGDGYGRVLTAMSDNVRHVRDLADPSTVSDIYQAI